jgi:hypothetical protein
VEELCGLSGEGDADQEARDALLTEDVARRLANGSFREAAALFEQVRVPKHDVGAQGRVTCKSRSRDRRRVFTVTSKCTGGHVL